MTRTLSSNQLVKVDRPYVQPVYLVQIGYTGLQTIRPTGDYSYTNWITAPLWSKVDEVILDIGDSISIGNAIGEALFSFPTPVIPITAVDINVRIYFTFVIQGTVYPALASMLRVGGVNYAGGPGYVGLYPLTSVYDDYPLNPKTGLAWTAQDINGGGSNNLTSFGVYCWQKHVNSEIGRAHV